jgi:3-hydroxybutyryl-CoA dehydratase
VRQAASKSGWNRSSPGVKELGMQTLGLGFTWEQLSPGQRFRTINRTLTETDLVLFTGMTGMLETIFIDRTFASEKGAIKGQFVPAALTYSLIEGLLCQSMIQGTGLAMLELKQQIRAPVRVGDTVHGEIEIVSVRPTSKANRGIVASRIEVKNQRDEVVMTYEATRMLAGRSPDEAVHTTPPIPPAKGAKGEGGGRRRPGGGS